MLNNCTELDNRSDDRYRSKRADHALPTGRIEVRRGSRGCNKNLIDCKRSISVRPHLICRRLSGSSGSGRRAVYKQCVHGSTIGDAIYELATQASNRRAIRDDLDAFRDECTLHIRQVSSDVRPGATSHRSNIVGPTLCVADAVLEIKCAQIVMLSRSTLLKALIQYISHMTSYQQS